MTGLELAAVIGVAIWLAALSFLILLITRQLGLITVRLSLVAPHAPADDEGPEVGSVISDYVRGLIGRDGEATVLLFLSGTCGTCRSLAEGLGERDVDPTTVALIGGQESLAEAIADLLPDSLERRFDPAAGQISQHLELEMVPFGLRIESGVVSAKAFLNEPRDVRRLISTVTVHHSADRGDHENGSSPLPNVVRAGNKEVDTT